MRLRSPSSRAQIRRFDQLIQASSSCGYVAERIQRTRISYDFWNATDAEGDNRFSSEHRLKNAQAEAFVFGCVESGIRSASISSTTAVFGE